MNLFTSDRERRLWLWTLAVVVAIYSTLGLAATLAWALRDRDLIDAFFVLGALVVGATILTQGLKTRPGGAEICVALGVAAAYLMVFVRMAIPAEERTHLIEYGVVAVFIHEALTERVSQGRRIPVPALLAVLATALVGVLDECIQAFLPSRVFRPPRHPVQRPGGRDGGRCERGARLGTTAVARLGSSRYCHDLLAYQNGFGSIFRLIVPTERCTNCGKSAGTRTSTG